MTATLRALALGALAALAIPSAALAAPDRTYNLNSGKPTAEWSGTGTGAVVTADVQELVACTPGINDCDFTLVKLDSYGQLTVGLTSGDATAVDIDLHLYESDESGTQGKLLKESVSPTATEQIVVELDPGYYLVMIDYYAGGGGFDANAKWESLAPPVEEGGATPPPAAEPPAAQPNTPPASTVKVKSRNKAKSLKTFKGTASDSDGSVAKVEIGLLWKKGSKCKQLTRSGSLRTTKCGQPTTFLAAKGTSSWTFKLRKRLPKGRYTIFVRATDDKGAMEAGFGKTNRRSFSVS